MEPLLTHRGGKPTLEQQLSAGKRSDADMSSRCISAQHSIREEMKTEGQEESESDMLSEVVVNIPSTWDPTPTDLESLVLQLDTEEEGTVIEVRHERDRVVTVEISRGGVVKEVTTPHDLD